MTNYVKKLIRDWVEYDISGGGSSEEWVKIFVLESSTDYDNLTEAYNYVNEWKIWVIKYWTYRYPISATEWVSFWYVSWWTIETSVSNIMNVHVLSVADWRVVAHTANQKMFYNQEILTSTPTTLEENTVYYITE